MSFNKKGNDLQGVADEIIKSSIFAQNLSNLQPKKIKSYSQIDSNGLTKAMERKTFIYDRENDRILALTDDEIIEIDDNIKKAITMAARDYFRHVKERIEKRGFTEADVSDLLKHLENTNATYIETPEFLKVKRQANLFLADALKNGDEETRRIIEKGIYTFFSQSRASISSEEITFTNLPYKLKHGEEKEFYRNEYIIGLLRDGVVDYQFLYEAGIISNLNFFSIDELLRKGNLVSYKELENALIISGSFDSREEILEYYCSNDRRFFINFANSEELAKAVINKKIEAKEAVRKLKIDDIKDFDENLLEELLCVNTFPKNTDFIDFVSQNGKTERYLNRDLLRKLNRDSFLKIVLSSKIKYKNPLNSNDYIKNYGKLTSDDIILLNENGLIEPEDVIKLIKFDSIKAQDENEYSRMIENEVKFYDIDRLEALLKEDKINGRYVELFNDLITNHLTDKQKEDYFKKMSEELKEKENGEELLVSLIKKGIHIENEVDYQISINGLTDMYIEEKIDENDIINFYGKGFIQVDILKEFFSDDELINRFKDGSLDYRILGLVENRKIHIKEALEAGNIGIQEIMELYSSDNGIDIDEFEQIVEGYDLSDVNISEFIPETIQPDRIEELFRHYYISHDDLSVLVERKLITQEQSEEYAKQMASHEAYESIFSGKSNYIVLTREDIEGEGTSGYHRDPDHHNVRATQVKNDPILQEMLLDKIGFDDRVLELQGYNNSLAGYRVYPSEELGVMIFLNNSTPQNATYIMSLQQGLYFLNKTARESNKGEQENNTKTRLESNATKRTLRETEHVKVKNASRGWGKNIVDSVKKLSPTFRDKIRNQDKYRAEIEKIIEEIREDYDLRKG